MFRAGGAAVVVFWLVMLVVLSQRDMTSAAGGPEMGAVPKEQWFGIYLEGRKIGYSYDKAEKTASGYMFSEEMDITVTMMGVRQEMKTSLSSNTEESLLLKDFEFGLNSGYAATKIKGKVFGKALKLEVDSGGGVEKRDMALDEPPHLSTDIELYLQRHGLKVGAKYRLPFFDPSSLSQQYIEIEVDAVEDMKLGDRLVSVYRVRQEYSGLKATSWISKEEGTIKGEGPMGLTFLKETREQATKKPEGVEAADMVALTSVRAKGEVENPRTASFLKARLTGIELDGLPVAGGRQALDGGVIAVTKEDIRGLAPPPLPISGKEFTEFLRPGPFIQSDDPRITAKAKEILGREKDSLKAAEKLCDWVYRTLEKKPSAGIPSAVEVLENLSGDCNEHTALYSALARAAGIPAKTAGGIVMLDGRFYYHAWPEVYVGRWVSIDPTFGQFPSDATHIRLVEGPPGEQLKVLRAVGNLSVEILESR